MKSKKVLSLLLGCAVTVSMGTTVFASTEDQIAAAQAQKQEAQAKVQNGNDKSQQPKTYENEFIQKDSSPKPFR